MVFKSHLTVTIHSSYLLFHGNFSHFSIANTFFLCYSYLTQSVDTFFYVHLRFYLVFCPAYRPDSKYTTNFIFFRKEFLPMQNNYVVSYAEAKGVIEYNMTNNYMFRYILQQNKKVLTGLICSLLHLKPENVRDIEVTNPIDLAGDVSGKEFILDINVKLNDDTIINLEMQVANEHNWPERSLMYLCRAFDHLYRGQEYEEALPVYHIGFLDFTLFSDAPEFYATYKLLNIKNHKLYSDKFTLSVVDLTQTELATEEDNANRIDYWARLFKAKTWEDLKMLAQNNEYLEEAANSIYQANAKEIVRQQCRAREDAERRERTLIRNYNRAIDELNTTKEALDSEKLRNTSLQNENASLQNENASLLARIRELEATNTNK